MGLLVLLPLAGQAQTWSPVGTGAGSAVYALEVFNDELYAGGTFTQIGGVTSSSYFLARWDGSAWSKAANLITFMAADGLYAKDTALYIGDGGRVRFWNGTNMFNLTGVNSSSFNSTAYSMAHFQDTLYVGGAFSSPFAHIARWDGSVYGPLTTGCNYQVTDLLPFGDQLFVGGNFMYAGDSLVNRTALWNGSAWNRMGAGVNDDVFTHCVFRDTLYIGGRFTQANGLPASRVAKWNGSQWVKVGGTLNDFVTAMAVYRDQLYIGGAFTTPSHIARLSGTTWVPVGTGCNDNVRTMEVYHDSLFVGGSFTTAGRIPAQRIAKWHLPEAPVASFSVGSPTLCPNECSTFTDHSPNGVSSRSWSFPGGVPTTSTDSTPTVCYALPGTWPVTLTVTNAGGTSSTTDSSAVFVDVCSGIPEGLSRAAFSVWPNPAHSSIEVRRDQAQAQAMLRIRDAAGRVVQEEVFSGTTQLLDINGLRPGLFVVSLESAEGRAYQPMLVE